MEDDAAARRAAVSIAAAHTAPQRPWNEVLGVSETATLEEIETAYRRLIARYHPDNVTTVGRGLDFQSLSQLHARAIVGTKVVNEAYERAKKIRS